MLSELSDEPGGSGGGGHSGCSPALQCGCQFGVRGADPRRFQMGGRVAKLPAEGSVPGIWCCGSKSQTQATACSQVPGLSCRSSRSMHTRSGCSHLRVKQSVAPATRVSGADVGHGLDSAEAATKCPVPPPVAPPPRSGLSTSPLTSGLLGDVPRAPKQSCSCDTQC